MWTLYPCVSGTVAKRIYQQGKGRRGLAAAWVAEVISWPMRAPLFKRPPETPLGEVGLHQIFRHTGGSKTGKCCRKEFVP